MHGARDSPQNSQILADLDVKLSHFHLIERSELSNLLEEYKETFVDKPHRNPIKQHLYRSQSRKE